MRLSSAAPSAPFCEQVTELTRLFCQWNECEQTVVLYALLRRMPAVQARFLAEAVQHTLHSVSQLNTQQVNANDTAFVTGLMSESTETVLQELLLHLPLLKPGNSICKEAYLLVIQEIINYCVSTGQFTDLAQQLLSYTLIHPAITCRDRRSLKQWLKHLEDRISNTPTSSLPNTNEYMNAASTNRWESSWKMNDMFRTHLGPSHFSLTSQPPVPPPPQPISRQRRSNSLTPPDNATSRHHEPVDRASNANSSCRHKPRSFSVSGDHASNVAPGPLSPQGSCASSGSEGRLDDASSRSLASGMRDVPIWLKSLRLHKYGYLFTSLSYEDMLALTESQLESSGVTKGARHKLVLSIAKLKQRYNTLLNLERGLLEPTGAQACSFTQGAALFISTEEELKAILATPIKPSQESDVQDIPTQFVKVLGKLCSKLLMEPVMDDNSLVGCINILEKVLQHDCFTPSQKEKVQQWRSRLGNPRQAQKWQQNCGYNNRRYNSQHNRKPNLNSGNIYNTPNTHNNLSYMASPHRNSIPCFQHTFQNTPQGHLRPASIEKRPSLQETHLQNMRFSYRTNSVPRDYSTGPGTSSSAARPTPHYSMVDISHVEKLCVKMAEEAIET